MPQYSPFEPVGQVQREIQEFRRLLSGKANGYEMDTLRNRLDTLERTIRECRSIVDGMESRLQELEADYIGDRR